MKNLFLNLAIISFVLAVLPMPFAFLMESTALFYLLLLTIPIGGTLGSVFLIIWAVLQGQEKKTN
jgi:hypothetical protein